MDITDPRTELVSWTGLGACEISVMRHSHIKEIGVTRLWRYA